MLHPKLDDINSETILVDRETAREWRKDMHFEGQRNRSEYNVQRLALEMMNCRFTPGTQIYIAVLPNGKKYILNGNHTLDAIVESGLPQVLTITYNNVESMREAGDIYAVFDDQMKRKLRDALRARGLDVDETQLHYMGPALNVIINRFLQQDAWRTVPKLLVTAALEHYQDAAEAYFDATAHAPKETRLYCRRAPIMALGLETMRYQQERATEFWGRFASDDGLIAGMPEHTLLRYLRNNPATVGPARASSVRAGALAWNAAYKGSPLQQVKPDAFKHFTLAGTPWEKGLPKAPSWQQELSKAA